MSDAKLISLNKRLQDPTQHKVSSVETAATVDRKKTQRQLISQKAQDLKKSFLLPESEDQLLQQREKRESKHAKNLEKLKALAKKTGAGSSDKSFRERVLKTLGTSED